MEFSAVFILFVTLIVGAQSCALIFKDDGSKGAKVTAVNFNGTCDSEQHAILKKGTYVQLQVSIDSNENTKKLTSDVHGIIAGVPVEFPLVNPDACQACNITCPIQQGKQYVYAPVIDVKKDYPSISLVVRWELKDDNGIDFIRIVMPVIISV